MLQGKWVLITGASSGIGYEFARICAREKYNLVLVARREDKLKNIKQEIERDFGVQVKLSIKDLAQPEAAHEICTQLTHENITIDILINSAGFGNYGLFTNTDLDEELSMVQVNISAVTTLTKLFAKDMVKRGSGKILNVASTAAFQPGPLMAVYYATKAYVLSFTEALANELSGTGVTITALCPGPTASEFQTVAKINDSKLFTSNIPTSGAVAEYGYQALMKGKTIAVYGTKNKIGAFLVRFAPRRFVTNMVRKIQS